jgi:hypothetical protein
MKKYVITLLVLLSLSSPAFADSFGVHLTYPLTIGAQYTIDNVFGADTALRFWGTAVLGGAVGGVLQVDSMLGRYALTPENTFAIYYGLGGHVGFVTAGSGSVSATGVIFGFQGTGGLSYTLAQNMDVFLEGSAGYSLGFASATVGSTSVTLPIGGNFYRIGGGLNFKF